VREISRRKELKVKNKIIIQFMLVVLDYICVELKAPSDRINLESMRLRRENLREYLLTELGKVK
jgi:hypothetical protein